MSLLRILVAVLAAALALAAAPGLAAGAEPGVVQSERYDPATEVQTTAGIGARWVRLFVRWDLEQGSEPPAGNPCAGVSVAQWKQRASDYAAQGIKVLTVVQYTPAWANGGQGFTVPPADPQHYANFVKCLADIIGDRVPAFEVWNEPDDKIFWHNGPQPAKYAALLKATYATVKPAHPNTTILVGGLVGNDFEFVEDLYENGAKGHFDAVGVHTDTACLTVGPDHYYREPSGRIGRYSFTGYREVRQTMLDHGEDKPIWMTEIGWSSLTTKCAHPGVTVDRPSGVGLEKQAEYLRAAYACVAADPFVHTAFWFSLVDAGTDNRYDHHLGLMNHAFAPKPAFNTYRDLFAGRNGPGPDPNCGAKVDRDKPTVSIKVPAQYFTRFSVEGSASDPTTPVNRIELWVDGKRVEGMNMEGGTYKKDWFGSTNLSLGRHTVELRAFDEAQNMAIAGATVTKVDPAAAARTATARLTFSARKRPGRKIRVDARVLRALTGEFTEQPRGRLRIFFDRRVAGKWRRTSRYTKGISKRIALTYTARKPGRWRVWARLAVDAPYRNARTKYFRFRL